MDELHGADINEIKAFVKTEGGRKLLLLLANHEATLLAEAYSSKSSLEKQGQIVNRVSGIYWVRTLIDDIVNKK